MSDISSITQSAYAQLFNPYSGYNLQQYSDLGLSETQRTQIRSIIRSAQSDGLTLAQVQQQIGSVLTPQQLTQLQNANASSSNASTGTSTASTSSTTASTATTGSTNPFANLDLTSSEESQIEQLLQNAQSNGMSFEQFNSQLSSILSPSQQSTFQSDVQSVLQQINAAATSQAQQSGPPNPFNDPNGPFANLNLTSSQQSQIQQILQNAQSQGLSPDQVNSQINAVLSSSQQSSFASDLQNLTPGGSQPSSTTTAGTSDILDNLNLTPSQKSEIQTILQSASSDGLSASDVFTQIQSVLSQPQQATLSQNLKNMESVTFGSRGHRHGGLNETDTQNQVAAANSAIVQYLQNELTTLGVTTAGAAS